MKSSSPNILLIMMDDMGWGDLSCHENSQADTPYLDALATAGAEAEQFFASPVCSPTRASVLTGRYYSRTGVSRTGQGYETIRADEITLADILAGLGYATGCFGKWHNGSYYPYTADGRGFAEFSGFSSGYINNYFDATLDSTSGPLQTKGFLVDVLAELAQDFITRHHDHPWFCYVPFNVPHVPFQAPDDLFEKYKDRGCDAELAAVYAMNESADRAVGRLLWHLEKHALAEDTIVVFMSDHGPNTQRFNAGMRGIKGCLHEGGVRVPFFMRWSGHIPSHSQIKQPMAHIDLVPTLLGLVGLEAPRDIALDGLNLSEIIRSGGRTKFEDRLLFDYFDEVGAVRTTTHRMLIPANDVSELYDLSVDPGETTNLLDGIGVDPEDVTLAKQLHSAYETWALDVGAGKSDRSAIPIGHSQSPQVTVRSLDVESKTGSLRMLPGWGNQNWLTNWTDLNSEMTWRLEIVTPGIYSFVLIHTCAPGDEGSKLQLTVGDHELVRNLAHPFVPTIQPLPDRVKPRPGPPQQTWGTLDLGNLKLETGKTRMTLCAITMQGAAIADVWGVRISLKSPRATNGSA